MKKKFLLVTPLSFLALFYKLVQDLLKTLPQMFTKTLETQSALGPALQAAFKLMSPTGGRMSVFQTQLPTLGVGALRPREEPNQRSSAKVRMSSHGCYCSCWCSVLSLWPQSLFFIYFLVVESRGYKEIDKAFLFYVIISILLHFLPDWLLSYCWVLSMLLAVQPAFDEKVWLSKEYAF